jgi:hypothetical protein
MVIVRKQLSGDGMVPRRVFSCDRISNEERAVQKRERCGGTRWRNPFVLNGEAGDRGECGGTCKHRECCSGKGRRRPRRRGRVVIMDNQADDRVGAAAICRLFGSAAAVGLSRSRREQVGRDGLAAAEVRHHREAGRDGKIEADEADMDCRFHTTKISHLS